MSININFKKLGFLDLEAFVTRKDVDPTRTTIAVVGLGQGGGKMAVEFNRLGHYVSLYNTCKEDLDNAEETLKYIGNENYKVVKFEGYDGARKDREIGLQAVKDNLDLLEDELVDDVKLQEVDFVWITAALGGGTGSGSVPAVAKILSSHVRDKKRIGVKYNKDGTIKDFGQPTLGVIVAMPDQSSKHGMKLNAANALRDLKKLQNAGVIGNILIVDNQKLINDFLAKPDNEVRNIDWVTYGNTTIAQIITEQALISSLPGDETLDKSELLDIWSSPGFLTTGKFKFHENWREEFQEVNALVKKTFDFQNIFANGFDLEDAIHGGMAVLSSSRSNIINNKDKILFKSALYDALGVEAKNPHCGIYENEVFGRLKDHLNSFKNNGNINHLQHKEALMYTLAVVKTEPQSVLDMTEKAIEKEEERMEKSKELVDGLAEKLKQLQPHAAVQFVKQKKRSLADLLEEDEEIAATDAEQGNTKKRILTDDLFDV